MDNNNEGQRGRNIDVKSDDGYNIMKVEYGLMKKMDEVIND